MMRKISILLFIFLFLGGILSFYIFTRGSWDIARTLEMKAMEKERDALYYQIQELVDTSATDILQCRTIGLGQSLCGGPASYLVYSVKNTDEVKIESLAKEYNDVSERWNNLWSQRDGVFGICTMETPPKLKFDATLGKCVAQ